MTASTSNSAWTSRRSRNGRQRGRKRASAPRRQSWSSAAPNGNTCSASSSRADAGFISATARNSLMNTANTSAHTVAGMGAANVLRRQHTGQQRHREADQAIERQWAARRQHRQQQQCAQPRAGHADRERQRCRRRIRRTRQSPAAAARRAAVPRARPTAPRAAGRAAARYSANSSRARRTRATTSSCGNATSRWSQIGASSTLRRSALMRSRRSAIVARTASRRACVATPRS